MALNPAADWTPFFCPNGLSADPPRPWTMVRRHNQNDNTWARRQEFGPRWINVDQFPLSLIIIFWIFLLGYIWGGRKRFWHSSSDIPERIIYLIWPQFKITRKCSRGLPYTSRIVPNSPLCSSCSTTNQRMNYPLRGAFYPGVIAFFDYCLWQLTVIFCF